MTDLSKIKHLVVLMMENRSFDHMLGMMMAPDYAIDGLRGTESNPDGDEKDVQVNADATISGDLTPDPGHHYPDVNMQIFGNYEARDDGGPKMMGFVRSFQDHTHDVAKSHRIMNCFSPDKIPVITTLARQYANCDRWFSSVPGPTLPNRSFMHAATSIGRVDMSPIWADESTTIYELLAKFGVKSKIYYEDFTVAMTFKALVGNQGDLFGRLDDFKRACKTGNLPAYSFIEPRFNAGEENGLTFEATDQHPDHNVSEGETFIKDVYNAIRTNQTIWESTILAIVYDEHGGLYDHVTPPATVNPDGKNTGDPGENVAPDIPPFDFTRLGIRVPAIIVSPYIEAGTIDSNVYDHTSIIATARKLFLGDKWKDNFLTLRDKGAATFDQLLTRDTPRQDVVNFKAPQGIDVALLADLQRTNSLNKPLSTHQQALVQHAFELEQQLPEGRRSGVASPDQIQTEGQASTYLRAVAEEIRRSASAGAAGGQP